MSPQLLQWMLLRVAEKVSESHKPVICPQCRTMVLSVGRNHFLHNIEEALLQTFPLLKRSDEELIELRKSAFIQSSLILSTRKFQSRKRPSPPTSDDSHGMDFHCPQCVAQLGGFRCSEATLHLQCHACGGMMPSRSELGIPQNCLGCNRAFCGAYWQALGMNFSLCSRETFKPVSEHTISGIPDSVHQSNRHEQSVGKPLQAVISDWIVKLGNREIDRSRMPLSNAETISPESHLCNECYHKLVGYLLYWFRLSMPKHLLPPESSNREDCWYGYACRTQHHNAEHARNRNHVCRPTHGSPNAPRIS